MSKKNLLLCLLLLNTFLTICELIIGLIIGSDSKNKFYVQNLLMCILNEVFLSLIYFNA